MVVEVEEQARIAENDGKLATEVARVTVFVLAYYCTVVGIGYIIS